MPTSPDLHNLLLKDPSLDEGERTQLAEHLKDPKFFDKLMEGAMGASLAYATARFLKLSRPIQIMLTVAGFGLGRLIADKLNSKKERSDATTYDPEKHTFNVAQ
jgi:hypothetical protein